MHSTANGFFGGRISWILLWWQFLSVQQLCRSPTVDRNAHVGSIIVDVRVCLPKESSAQSQRKALHMSFLHFCLSF